jgi:uncharacterized protein (UPF0216 family)
MDPNVGRMISEMNRHMPSSRRSLLEHTESGDRTYRTKDGHTCSFDKEEIDLLNKICSEIERMRLRLPIFVSTDPASENAWKVDGTVETAVVSKLLERKPFRDDMMRFYHPDLKRLRDLLPNAVTVLYLP